MNKALVILMFIARALLAMMMMKIGFCRLQHNVCFEISISGPKEPCHCANGPS